MKKIILCIVSAAVILSIGLLPEKILSGVTHYSMIQPVRQEYQPHIVCNGFVMAQEGVQMVVGSNVVVKKLWVTNGSWVSAGQLLAETEPPQASEVFLNQSLDAPMAQLNSSELEALASQYGVEVPGAAQKLLSSNNRMITSVETPIRRATAPISGILSWNTVTEGRFLPMGSSFCTILGLDCYQAVVQIPAEDANLIQIGAVAEITGPEIGGQAFDGTVLSVGNSINREITTGGYSAVIEVKLAVNAPAGSMRQGAGVSCTIATGRRQALLTLPYEAIRQDDRNNEYVYRAVNSVLKKQYIKTGMELDDSIEVTYGLTEGDLVAAVDAEQPQKRYIFDLAGSGPKKPTRRR